MHVNSENGAVLLQTNWDYRRPTDFEGSHERVTLTRYADGELRRVFSEMHD